MSRPLRTLAALMMLLLVTRSAAALPAGEVVELDEAEVYLEYNATDDEYIVVIFWDADAWKSMLVRGPTGPKAKSKPVLNVSPKAHVRKQGLTEGYFETEALDLEESTLEEFLARFPEGEYTFKGKGVEKGVSYVGDTEFTHALPDDPANVSPDDGDMFDAGSGVTISFDPVTEDLDGNPITIASYTVVVEYESPISGDDLVFSMMIEGTEANPQVSIPDEFLFDETEYTLEIIVQAETGNRTICELDFETN